MIPDKGNHHITSKINLFVVFANPIRQRVMRRAEGQVVVLTVLTSIGDTANVMHFDQVIRFHQWIKETTHPALEQATLFESSFIVGIRAKTPDSGAEVARE